MSGVADWSTLDLTDLDLFAAGFPYDLFAELRRAAPVWWQAPTEHTPGAEGFWVITRHADVERVARDHGGFSSRTGPGRAGAGDTIIEDLPGGIGPGVMLNMCDPPEHTRIRGLVSRGFTPKGLRPLQPFLAERAAAIVDATLGAGGGCDFLVDVAAELPLQTIAQIMGVPQADRHQLFAWTSTILDFRDRDLAEATDELATAGLGMRAYGTELVGEKRTLPTGHGIHHCLGASLARMEIATMLEVLLDRCGGFEVVGPVVWGRSNQHTSIRHLPVRLHSP